MRDYAKVSPKFWIGATGKKLRGAGLETQIVGLYLLTCPHANMLGLFYCPVTFIAHETGLGIEGASKGLAGAIKAGFCAHDEASEVVWVYEMARFQVGERLEAKDLRCKGVQNEYDALPENPFLAAFFHRYAVPFCMARQRGELKQSGEAPSKPLLSQEQEQEQEEELSEEDKSSSSSAGPTKGRPQVPCQYQAIVDAYHAALPMLPAIRVMDDKRKALMRKRWAWVLSSTKQDGSRRATTGDEAVAWFVAFFERAQASDWLTGRSTPGKGHEGWRCTLDFLMKDDGLKAVVERTEAAA